MVKESRQPLLEQCLFELFDCAFGIPAGEAAQWLTLPIPTAEDITTVEQTLDVKLPKLLIELSRKSQFFIQWFAYLGSRCSPTRPNLSIIAKNEWLTRLGKPEDLVVLNQAYDGDCICISRAEPDPEKAPMINLSIDVWGSNGASEGRQIAPSFRAYLEDLCLREAPRTRVRSLRRKAKRLIEAWRDGRE